MSWLPDWLFSKTAIVDNLIITVSIITKSASMDPKKHYNKVVLYKQTFITDRVEVCAITHIIGTFGGFTYAVVLGKVSLNSIEIGKIHSNTIGQVNKNPYFNFKNIILLVAFGGGVVKVMVFSAPNHSHHCVWCGYEPQRRHMLDKATSA